MKRRWWRTREGGDVGRGWPWGWEGSGPLCDTQALIVVSPLHISQTKLTQCT